MFIAIVVILSNSLGFFMQNRKLYFWSATTSATMNVRRDLSVR